MNILKAYHRKRICLIDIYKSIVLILIMMLFLERDLIYIHSHVRAILLCILTTSGSWISFP